MHRPHMTANKQANTAKFAQRGRPAAIGNGSTVRANINMCVHVIAIARIAVRFLIAGIIVKARIAIN